MSLPVTFYLHDQCGCATVRSPIVGTRYRWMKHDIFTGAELGWHLVTCLSVDELRHDRIVCRRAEVRGDDGRVWHPFLQDFWARFQAVENVVPLRRKEGQP